MLYFTIFQLNFDKDSVHVESGDFLGFAKLNDSFPIPYVFNPQQSADLWYHSLDNKHRPPKMMETLQFEEIGFPYHFSIAVKFRADKKSAIRTDSHNATKDYSIPVDQNSINSKSTFNDMQYKSIVKGYKNNQMDVNDIEDSDLSARINAAMEDSVHKDLLNSREDKTNEYSANVSVNLTSVEKAPASRETSHKTSLVVKPVDDGDNSSTAHSTQNTGQEYKLSDGNMTDTSHKNESESAQSFPTAAKLTEKILPNASNSTDRD